ncbi:ATP-dependent RNA helicase HrpA [Alkalilimnicola ehrlichii]|uniref:ATP-dependent RNA helicase HrpA n=1 Tax=Alkalilimnicola ehrlichii TaxID=351052 RepID=UPI003BA09153
MTARARRRNLPDALRQLRPRIDRAFGPARPALRKRLAGLERRAHDGKPFDKGLVKLERDIALACQRAETRAANLPSPRFDPSLPVNQRLDDLREAIRDHQVVVICGATGSGKSTQIPKICMALGRGVHGWIGHTQPRRLAARTLAQRISDELGTALGEAVGYKVRFTDQVSERTHLKLLTDGMLLAEIQGDRHLDAYDTLIIDEAHERSLNIDFILGYLKRLLPRRPDLKVIITSATIDPERFSKHFDEAPILEVSGRTYPVEVRYRPMVDDEDERDEDLPGAVVEAVHELAREPGQGDVLVFLSGEREIRECTEALRKKHPPHTEVLPLYARLSAAEQQRVFNPKGGGRRVVLATNVAETSVTVPGIRYVVDSGYARINRYSYRTKVSRLPIEPISQASANQRAGRCGREAPGVAIRLYSEEDFAGRSAFTDPEIQRTNLAAVILQMKALGLGDIQRFPFVEPPEHKFVNDGFKLLHELGAVTEDRELTALGRQLARLPLDPPVGRMLLAAREQGVLDEVLVIAAALSVQDPRERPLDAQQAADQAHAQWRHGKSDFLSLVLLWQDYHRQKRRLSNRQLRQWCRERFLSPHRMREWLDIHRQIRELVSGLSGGADRKGTRGGPGRPQRCAVSEGAAASPLARPHTVTTEQCAEWLDTHYEAVHRALLSGLVSNIAQHHENKEYLGPRGVKLMIFPGSGQFKRNPKWIVAAEFIETSRLFARTVAEVKPEWIEQTAAHLVSRSYAEPHWEKKPAQVAAYEKVTLYGLVLASQRRVNYGPIDPPVARAIFIREALVQGEYRTRAPFWEHNRRLIEEIERLEAKARRRDVLVDEETRFRFYDQRIPEGIYSGAAFERWLREVSRDDPKRLHMSREALMRDDADPVSGEAYPDRLRLPGGLELPLEYHLEPGSELDGVVARVPVAALNQLRPEPFEWLVPGLVHEKVVALIRGLPKAIRRNFVPAPDFARAVLEAIPHGEGSLTDAVARQLKRMTGVDIPPGALDAVALPEHLRMHYRVLDEQGNTLRTGSDLAALQQGLGDQASESFSASGGGASEWTREGITTWDFGDLPEAVEIGCNGLTIRGYPCLVDQEGSVRLTLADSPDEAERQHRAGVRRLYMLALPQQVRYLRRGLPGLDRLRLAYRGLGSDEDLKRELVHAAIDRTFLGDAPPRTEAAFRQRLERGRPRLVENAQRLAQGLEEVLGRYQAIRKALKQFNALALMDSLKDLQEHLESLVYPGFLQQTPPEYLAELPRYLQALERRVEKLRQDPSRDRAPLRSIRPWWEQWRERRSCREAQGKPDPALERFRWLLEEYRVSLFAQEVGAREKVSEKRLKAAWKEVA